MGSSIRTLLAIDCSQSSTWVVLKSEKRCFLPKKESQPQSHNEDLALIVNELFVEAGLSFKDLDLILLGSGPGSFTGLRISYSFVLGLAKACGCKVVPVSSLRAQAACALGRSNLKFIASFADARRSEVFISVYKNGLASLDLMIEDYVCSIEELTNFLAKTCGSLDTDILHVGFKPEGLSVENVFSEANLAEGLLACFSCGSLGENTSSSADVDGFVSDYVSFEGEELAALEPNYVRAVAAQTIAERAKK